MIGRFSDWAVAHLGRKATSGRIISEIDGLRFLSIAAVVMFHLAGYVAVKSAADFSTAPAGTWTAWFFGYGDRGVHLFFVISGFVLALPFASHHVAGTPKPRLRRYFLRRLTRLEPPYVVALTMMLPLAAFTMSVSFSELVPHFFAGLFYVHNLVYGYANTILPVAWSLEVEVQFYILAPLFALVFRAKAAWLRLFLMATIAIAAMTVRPYLPFRNTVVHFAEYFMVGFVLAELYLVSWRRLPSKSRQWDLAALLALALFFLVCRQGGAIEMVGLPIAWFLLAVAAFRGHLFNRLVSTRILVVIGGMCYTIYLLHYPIISAIGRFTVRLVGVADFATAVLLHSILILPPLLLICAVYFALIERPCMDQDWPTRMMSWLRIIPPPEAAAPSAGREVYTSEGDAGR